MALWLRIIGWESGCDGSSPGKRGHNGSPCSRGKKEQLWVGPSASMLELAQAKTMGISQQQRLGVSVVATRMAGVLRSEGYYSPIAPWGKVTAKGIPLAAKVLTWGWGDVEKMLPTLFYAFILLFVLGFVAATS